MYSLRINLIFLYLFNFQLSFADEKANMADNQVFSTSTVTEEKYNIPIEIQKIIHAAEKGDFKAQTELADMYLYGSDLPFSEEKAIKWYTKAADSGYVPAQNNLGVIYLYLGDENSAEKWLKLSAAQNNSEGLLNLGSYYLSDKDKKNNPTALSYIKKSAKLGNMKAQYELGMLYETNDFFPKNYETSLYWYKKSAKQNYSFALSKIGMFYEKGLGVDKNIEKAKAWYQKGCELRSGQACYAYNQLIKNTKKTP